MVHMCIHNLNFPSIASYAISVEEVVHVYLNQMAYSLIMLVSMG